MTNYKRGLTERLKPDPNAILLSIAVCTMLGALVLGVGIAIILILGPFSLLLIPLLPVSYIIGRLLVENP